MKNKERFSIVSLKIFIFYVVTVIVVTLFPTIITNLNFRKTFNEQVEQLHENRISQLSLTLENRVLKPIFNIYMKLTDTEFVNKNLNIFLDGDIEGNRAKILEVYQHLQNIANENSDIINSVTLYFQKSNMILSSYAGLKYLDDDGNSWYDEANWYVDKISIHEADINYGTRGILSKGQSNSDFIKLITHFKGFPGNSRSNNFIFIDIRQDAINEIINSFFIEEEASVILLGINNDIITGINHESVDIANYFEDLEPQGLLTENRSGSFVDLFKGKHYVISNVSLPYTAWKLVSIININELYKKTDDMNRTQLVICITAVIIGFIMAFIFSKNLYKPLKTIMIQIKSIFNSNEFDLIRDSSDYSMIDSAIRKLSSKSNELQTIVVKNQPLIKQNLISGILMNRIQSKNEIEERKNLLGIKLDQLFYCCLIIQFKGRKNIDINDGSISKSNEIINQIESWSDNNITFLGTKLNSYSVGFITGLASDDLGFIINASGKIIESISLNNDNIPLISVGKIVNDVSLTYLSYNDAIDYIYYSYFFPEQQLFTENDFCSRTSLTSMIDDSYINELLEILNLRKKTELISYFNSYLAAVDGSSLSYKELDESLNSIVQITLKYCANNHLDKEEYLNIANYRDITADINIFKTWFIDRILDIWQKIEDRNADINNRVIYEIKKYIDNNLSNDLSLTLISTKFYICAPYISKLFKEKTGINLVDYICKKRLEKAYHLLENSTLSIENITTEVGFNSPSYFIYKFKKNFGDTPNNYRKKFAFR